MASSSRPSSVRGLYTPPAEEWVFLPPTVSPPAQAPPTPSHLPTPFSSEDDNLTQDVGMYGPLQIFFAEYFTTALGMPFEVGKTLLQIEYRPRKRYDTEAITPPLRQKERDWGAEDDTLSNPEEADVYFTDRLAAPTSSFIPPPEPTLPDASGYLPDLHPSWLLKDDIEISRSNGVWGMIRRVRATPGEGLPALWKSQLITTIHGLLVNFLQPQVLSSLSSFGPTNLSELPLSAAPHPAIPLVLSVTSHLLTHLVLSPIEIIRTRMIAMPSGHGTPGSVTMFRRIIDEEGGFAATYFNSNLFFPAVLEHTIRPLVTLGIPLLLERQFGLSPEFAPVTYSLADLGLNLASLLVLLPIETVRRRLQLQSRAPKALGGARGGVVDGEDGEGGKKMRTVVRIRDKPYVGIVEAIWRIVTEETGVTRKRIMTEKDEGGVFAGIRQLYRGFGMAATAHATVFGLGLVSSSLGGRGFDGGWKEI